VLSLLSYLMKAPLVPAGTPVVNALGAQRQVRHAISIYHFHRVHRVPSALRQALQASSLLYLPSCSLLHAVHYILPNTAHHEYILLKCIINVFRACVGLPAEDFMQLEHKVTQSIPLLLPLYVSPSTSPPLFFPIDFLCVICTTHHT
jgi:hypothetical protein